MQSDQGADVPTLARVVLHEAKRMVRENELVTGDRAVVLDGPGGVWKLKMYKNGRGSMNLNVCAPRFEKPLYSIQAIREALVHTFRISEDVLDSPDDLPDVAEEEHDPPQEGTCPAAQDSYDSPLWLCAVVRVQTAYRAHRFRRNVRRMTQLRREFVSIQAEMTSKAHTMTTLCAVVTASAASEGRLREQHPLVVLLTKYPVVSTTLSSVDVPVMNLLSIMTHPTGIERSAVLAYADDLMKQSPPKSVAFRASKAVYMAPHFPLIIGSLPLPVPHVFEYTTGSRRAFVRCSRIITPEHTTLLTHTFGRKWLDYCKAIVHSRDVRTFDLFSDRALQQYRCSILVSKHLVRVRGSVKPAVHIESMASSQRRCGNGTLMMNLCKTLAFSDGVDIPSGFLFAQCLKIDFWEYRLHEDPRAQAMILQMHKLYDEYGLESHCVMKMTELFNEEDSAPSPAKKLP